MLPFVAVIWLGGCEPASEAPSVVRIGVLPDQSREALETAYGPLLEYLSVTLGMPHELVVPRDYGHLLELFHGKKVDLAYFGGLTFLKANHADGALPLVMRDVDARFASYFLVRADDPAASLKDLRQRVFTFGSKLSTSGHLMPRHHLQQQGMTPESFFSETKYSGAHDKTAYWVRDGIADIGAINGQVANAMFADGRLKENEVQILWRTPPYIDYVWAIRKEVPANVRAKLQDAFLALSTNDPTQAEILSRIGAGRFLPVGLSSFGTLAKIAADLGLIKG